MSELLTKLIKKYVFFKYDKNPRLTKVSIIWGLSIISIIKSQIRTNCYNNIYFIKNPYRLCQIKNKCT